VHDLVDGKRGRRLIRMRAVVGIQGLGDLGQPFVQLGRRACIERWHRAHHARLALGDHQLGRADDEHGRCNHRERNAFQYIGQGHEVSLDL